MSNKEKITELMDYFQSTENTELQFDEEAIAAAYQKSHDHQSLVIKILSIFGGVLASVAFLGFLLIAGFYKSDLGLLILGIVCIGGSIWISKVYDKIIIDTFSVSSYIIGFILISFGLDDELFSSENTNYIIFILIGLISLSIVQSYIFAFISILIINGSILALIMSNKVFDLMHVYVSALAVAITYLFMKEAEVIAENQLLSKLYNPLRIGLIFSFLAGLFVLNEKGGYWVAPEYIWISSILIIGTILYVLSHLFDLLEITNEQHKNSIYVASVLVLLPTVFCPAISGAILIILLSFWVNYKTAFVIGIAAFVYFLGQYYYDLNFTLLTKSILLLSSGVLFIGLYLFTHQKLTSNEQV